MPDDAAHLTALDSLGRAADLARVAALSPIAYDQCRASEAERLGVRVSTLDAEVAKLRRSVSGADSDGSEPPDDLRPPEFTDESLALKFADRHRDRLRFVAAWGRWYIWNGTVWSPDGTMHAFDLVRALCREESARANDDNVASAIASAQTVAAVERLAKADRRLAATTDQWDADPWLLNTPAGIMDLRISRLRPHRPEDYSTKITAVSPDGDCPLWRNFLARITARDPQLQLFLQRAMGYSLTGTTREHALFFGHGTGGNGKGVFLNTATAILGSYATVASMETFTATPNDRHPADLAMLRGARLVTAQETEEGRRWAEARIKALTGGDPITARFMRQDFFTFVPQFKLFIVGNHKPGLRNVDEAIRRRFNLIPFTVCIPPSERDPDLAEKLKEEWPGILLWMVDGCALWQEHRLSAPAAVVDATKEYLEAEDALGQWLAERCVTLSTAQMRTVALFDSWKAWAEKAGEFPGSQKRFSQALQARGFELGREAGTGRAIVKGIAFPPPPPRNQPATDGCEG